MNIQQLAADIAARVPAMAQDTPINNADLIARLIFHECAGCNDIDRECAKWRGRCAELEARLGNPFPIQDGPSVPWSVMLPHEAMAKRNHDQTLQRLAERGGLGAGEAWCVVSGIDLGKVFDKAEKWEEWKQKWFEFAEKANAPCARCLELEAEIRGLREFENGLRESVYKGSRGGMLSPHP